MRPPCAISSHLNEQVRRSLVSERLSCVLPNQLLVVAPKDLPARTVGLSVTAISRAPGECRASVLGASTGNPIVTMTGTDGSDFTSRPLVGMLAETPPTRSINCDDAQEELRLISRLLKLSQHVVFAGLAPETFEAAFRASTGRVDGMHRIPEPNPAAIIPALDRTMPGAEAASNAKLMIQINTNDLEGEGLRCDRRTTATTIVGNGTQACFNAVHAPHTSGI